MQRRSVFALLAGSVLAGCSTLGSTTTVQPPQVEQTFVSALDRRCTETATDEATVSFDETEGRVTVTGTIDLPRVDQELAVVTRKDSSSTDAMRIRIDYRPSDDGAGGDDCAGEVSYEAEATFTRLPDTVILNHVSQNDAGEYVAETVTTAER